MSTVITVSDGNTGCTAVVVNEGSARAVVVQGSAGHYVERAVVVAVNPDRACAIFVRGGVAGRDGDPGAPGADGRDGVDGAPGLPGRDGVDGKDGEPGPPGTTTWAGITDKPATYPPGEHEHTIANVTGLQPALDGKQATLVSGTNIKTVGGASLLGAGDIPVAPLPIIAISASTTAAKGNAYLMTASLTLTLPASPEVDDQVGFINASGTATCVIARNGSLLMGLTEDMVLNKLNVGETLVYTGAAKGWWVR